MRAATTETVSGQIMGTGEVRRGPAGCQRSSAGIYYLYFPPHRKLVSLSVTPFQPAAWALVQYDQLQDRTVRVLFANTGGTVNIDTPFTYTAEFAA